MLEGLRADLAGGVTGGRIREAGDSALLLELDAVIDPEVNARAVAIADAVVRQAVPGVLDVVPTFNSVAVHFDPLGADAAAVRAAIEQAGAERADPTAGALVEIPVSYGGESGPDLQEVAAWAGLSPAAVVERHAAAEYRVYMMGFLPGFAYLAPVDPAIAAPRRATPRIGVAAGSVGIAGAQTGVYPFESPGGWQIIGRTAVRMFDAERTPPALLAAGDRVRFVPVEDTAIRPPSTSLRPGRPDPTSGAPSYVGSGFPGLSGVEGSRTFPHAARTITVLKPGLFTTVQDEGRWGYQRIGVPVSGAMDRDAHRAANLLVGNDAGAATLEATILGPELRMEADTLVAVAGADLGASLDGARVPAGEAVRCSAGSVLRFDRRRAGGRAYIAFSGGIAVPRVLGSRATHTRTRMGGFEGRALRTGDRVPLGAGSPLRTRGAAAPRLPDGGARLRVLPGPQAEAFPPGVYESLAGVRFAVSPDSDRMGYRLVSDRPIPRGESREMISGATFAGGLQVPVSGQPVLLMADRQTTGGYPQIAVVISADLPLAGQLVPGDWVEFEPCSMAQAAAARGARARDGGA